MPGVLPTSRREKMTTNWTSRKVALLVTLLSGCAVTSVPVPVPVASGTPALQALPSPKIIRAGENSAYQFANPAPTVKLFPDIPCKAGEVSATASGLPPGQAFEWWLTPPNLGGWKAGAYHPSQNGGTKLGQSVANARGEAETSPPVRITPPWRRSLHPLR
jgi:hypothetical protein